MAELFSAFLHALRSTGRRTTPWVLALVLGTGVAFSSVGAAEASTKAPSGLTVVVSGPTTLDVSWSSVKGASKYRVAYDTASAMKKPAYAKVADTSVQLSGLKPGQRYYVKVRALKASGKSLTSYTSKVKATTSASYDAPDGLQVTGTGTSSVALDWKSSGAGVDYRVQYADNTGMDDAAYARFGGSDGTVTGLDAGKTYWFKVRVITGDGGNLSPYSDGVRGATDTASSGGSSSSGSATMRVGTFNIKCASCAGDHPNERTWWDRRDDVVADINSQDLDVLGIQEASQGWLKTSENGTSQDLSQFEDLRNRLGGPWKLTNANRNNCVKAKTPTNCVYKDQGASQGTKILYNSSTIDLVDQGSKELTAPGTPRYMAWAILRQKSTGKEFFFATAHLEPNKDWDLHVTEAREVVAEVAKQNTDHLPTFITGDMNAHKNTKDDEGKADNPVAKVIVNESGYVDPLGNASGSTTDTPGATVEHRINTPLGSFNDFMPTPSPNYFGRRPNGTYIDYIFTSKKIEVKEWENVAHLDADHNYVGKQASDHNLQRATVVLP